MASVRVLYTEKEVVSTQPAAAVHGEGMWAESAVTLSHSIGFCCLKKVKLELIKIQEA